MARSGATAEDFAAVAVKNQHNGGLNPRAQYGGDFTIEEILASRTIVEPLHLLMCSPISDGAAAVVSECRMQPNGGSDGPGPGSGPPSSYRQPARRFGSARGLHRQGRCRGLRGGELEPTEIDFAELHDASALPS